MSEEAPNINQEENQAADNLAGEPVALPEELLQDRLRKIRRASRHAGRYILNKLVREQGERPPAGGGEPPPPGGEGPPGPPGPPEEPSAGEDEPEEEKEPEGDELTRILQEVGLDDEKIRDVKQILSSDLDGLLKRYLSELGVDQPEVAEWMKASSARLTLKRLKELGLPEDKVDEAHKILVSEKGRLKVKHIVDLGFEADQAEDVQKLLRESPTKLVRQQLESLGIDKDRVDEIIATGDDEAKLVEAILQKIDLPEDVISKIREVYKAEETRAERAESLGYLDDGKIKKAHELGISAEAIETGKRLGYRIDLLISAVEQGDVGLHTWLVERGIELPGDLRLDSDEPPREEAKRERQKRDRSAARVADLFPPDDPNVIPKSEAQYLVEKIVKAPGWLRNSLIRPGSLPAPETLYHNPITRRLLELLNLVYRPLGQRHLARRLFNDYRARHPEDDYGPAGYGLDKRRQMIEHVQKVDQTVKRARRLLSLPYRHALRGNLRKNPRLDLAQEISEVNRDLEAFSLGRDKLPDVREQYHMLRDNPHRTPRQEKRLRALEELHPRWATEEYEKLRIMPHRNFEQQARYEYLSSIVPGRESMA